MTINRVDYARIPRQMMASLQAYIFEGRPVGSFLTGVLENNLREAVGNADAVNLELLPTFVSYMVYQAPLECWGSEEIVEQWKASGGLRGLQQPADARRI